jgi:hypothetical protein
MTAPVTWPVGFPQRPNAGDFTRDAQLNSELFKPDNGVTRGRRKAETLPANRTLSFDLTRAQYEDWLAFWRDDVKGGFLPLRFVDPVTAGNLDVLVVGNPTEVRLAVDVWRITLSLEEL